MCEECLGGVWYDRREMFLFSSIVWHDYNIESLIFGWHEMGSGTLFSPSGNGKRATWKNTRDYLAILKSINQTRAFSRLFMPFPFYLSQPHNTRFSFLHDSRLEMLRSYRQTPSGHYAAIYCHYIRPSLPALVSGLVVVLCLVNSSIQHIHTQNTVMHKTASSSVSTSFGSACLVLFLILSFSMEALRECARDS